MALWPGRTKLDDHFLLWLSSEELWFLTDQKTAPPNKECSAGRPKEGDSA